MIGRKFVAQGDCDVTVKGQIIRVRSGKGWQAIVQIFDGNGDSLGERRLETPESNCTALNGPLALVISLMVEEGQEEASLLLPPETRSVPTVETQHHATYRMRLGALGLSGLLPSLALGPSVGVAFSKPALPALLVEASFFAPERHSSHGIGGNFWAWQAGASLCPDVYASGVALLSLCGGLRAGAIHGSGVGLEYAKSAAKPYLLGQGALDAAVKIVGPLALQVTLGGAYQPISSRFVYLESDETRLLVHQPDSWVGFVGVGIELRGLLQPLASRGTPR